MKFVRTRLVISWLLFAVFLTAFWQEFYQTACLLILPAIVMVRLGIHTPRLSAFERRASIVAAVIINAFFFLMFFWEQFPPVVVTIAQIAGTLLVLAYGIFTDFSKFKQTPRH